MSGAAYEAMFVGGIIVGILAFIVAVFALTEGDRLWQCITIAIFLSAVASAITGELGVHSSAQASRHRECFTVTSVDNGQGFAHYAEIYATPHSYHPQSDDVLGVQPGRNYCGIVENDPARDLPVLVSLEPS